MINPHQARAARGLLGWDRNELAKRSGLSLVTLNNFENESSSPKTETLESIERVFRNAGIEFIENDGVRRRSEGLQTLTGRDGLISLLDDVFAHTSKHGGDVCVTGFDAGQWTSILGEYVQTHVTRMTAAFKARTDIFVKTIVREGSSDLVGNEYSEYKWQAQEEFDNVPFYVYGSNLAIISFNSDPSPKIIKISSKEIADAYRHQFLSMWDRAKPIADKAENE